MKATEFITNIFKTPDLKKRVLFTLFMLVIFRVLANIPIPGVDPSSIQGVEGQSNPFFVIFTTVTGGQLDNPSLVALGLAPYINASIIFQLLGTVIPKLEELQKEGERGRKVINQLTRYLTFPLALLQSVVIYSLLTQLGIVNSVSGIELVAFYLSLSAGTILLMWIAELITEKGIGNGPSFIIAAGILATFPGLLFEDFGTLPVDKILIVLGLVLIVVMAIVFENEAQRRLPIQYARRVRGGSTYGGADSYLPIRLNMSGVMPVIFASSLLLFPQLIVSFLINLVNPATRLYSILESISAFYAPENILWYNLIYFVLIIVFAFFYTFIVFKPKEVSDNLKKNGGFIPGIRPGSSTQKYLIYVVIRLTVVGSLFIAFVALFPTIINGVLSVQLAVLSLGIGGTAMLIVVGVILDMFRQAKSMLVTRSYDIYK